MALARFVLESYGIKTPKPQRSWYRRLRKKDTQVFKDELERWGEITSDLGCGVVALCKAESGYGMAVWFENGWLSFVESEVRWSPIGVLAVVECYCPQK